MNKSLSILLAAICLFVFYSFLKVPANGATEVEKMLTRYVTEKGYHVVSHEKTVHTYLLQREMLTKLPDMATWGLLNVDPMPYIGKTISIHRLTVTGHPLDQFPNSLGSTSISLYVCDGHIIGGTSLPVTKELLMGIPYSLDGKTLEEVTQQSFPKWRNDWNDNFKGAP
ncbi:hypothetical protein [Brevibacillus migulae]|uniref:hypothetical protein n=1 Tax=Brevibacillus migulae TaxID=1644114 RepID=UPI00106E6BB1|nr:hypothetical protein [Brevibacillus migulae]